MTHKLSNDLSSIRVPIVGPKVHKKTLEKYIHILEGICIGYGSPKDFKTVIDLVKTGVKYQQEIIDNNYKEIKELYHRLPYDPEHNELGYREDGDTKRNQ